MVLIPSKDNTLFLKISQQVEKNLSVALDSYKGPLFTSGPGRRKKSLITKHYAQSVMECFGPEVAEEFNCATCKTFLHNVGGLRGLNPDGTVVDMLWSPDGIEDEQMRMFFEKMHAFVMTQKTRSGVIVSYGDRNNPLAIARQCTVDDTSVTFGHKHLNDWPHYSITLPRKSVPVVSEWGIVEELERKLHQAYEQILVTVKEDALTPVFIGKVIQILRSDRCDREDFVGKAGLQWWLDLSESLTKDTLSWRNVILAKMHEKINSFPFATFALHSSVVWTIFADLNDGCDATRVCDAFKHRTASHRYMRPTTEPHATSVDRAEKMITEMGLTSALQRRGASLDDLRPYFIWTYDGTAEPTPVSDKGAESSRPFDILRKKTAKDVSPEKIFSSLTIKMTWEKFKSQVLPTIKRMWVKFTTNPVGVYTLMTQVDPDAKPLLVWDKDYARCPISWYTYVQGQPISTYKGELNNLYLVQGIMPNPSMRLELPPLSRVPVGGKGDFLIVDGLVDTKFATGGLRLFPEIIRRDLQTDSGIRRVINEYSNSVDPDQSVEAKCAVSSFGGLSYQPTFVVETIRGIYESYLIDRND